MRFTHGTTLCSLAGLVMLAMFRCLQVPMQLRSGHVLAAHIGRYKVGDAASRGGQAGTHLYALWTPGTVFRAADQRPLRFVCVFEL